MGGIQFLFSRIDAVVKSNLLSGNRTLQSARFAKNVIKIDQISVLKKGIMQNTGWLSQNVKHAGEIP
jgi:hypothetical protein